MRTGPDPERLGGLRWTEHTKGSLTSTERRQLVRPILRGQAAALAGRLALLAGQRPDGIQEIEAPPDSAMARAAERAADDQPDEVRGHAERTWLFGTALANVDGVELDRELFYIASLLHDVGLVEAVTGEDFTLRSAAAVPPVMSDHRNDRDITHVQDAITAHTTPGASIETDGAEAFYLQSGAVCDLGGLRLSHLAAPTVQAILDAHPRTGLAEVIVPLIRAEAAAVPTGRFALLCKTGFPAAVRMAPLPR